MLNSQNRLIVFTVMVAVAVSDHAHGEKPALSAPRPVQTEAARGDWVATLRDAYSRPPAEWPAPHVDPGVALRELDRLPPVVHPADNPYSPAKEQLGKALFFEPRLSASGEMACA